MPDIKLLILLVTCYLSLAKSVRFPLPPKSGCPEPIDTKPCVCYNSPFTNLNCEHLKDSEVLRQVFLKSSRYSFKEVHIEYSALQFLPHEVFGKVHIRSLYLKNVTLVQLFDAPPTSLEGLDTLHIENTKLLRGVIWKLFEPLTYLRILNIYFNHIKTLGLDFSEHTTKQLQQLTFHATETKVIKPGTFVDFVNLEKVAFESCKLTTLTRDIFPTPFNVKVLHFSRNQLSTIPSDLFSDMPQLQTVGLRSNHIAMIPETTFQGSLSNLIYLFLDDNPLICDCRLSWLVKNKPEALSGKCDSPSRLKDKELKLIKDDDINC